MKESFFQDHDKFAVSSIYKSNSASIRTKYESCEICILAVLTFRSVGCRQITRMTVWVRTETEYQFLESKKLSRLFHVRRRGTLLSDLIYLWFLEYKSKTKLSRVALKMYRLWADKNDNKVRFFVTPLLKLRMCIG